MGMNLKQIMYFFEILKIMRMDDLSSMSVCVFGNQIIRKHALQFPDCQFYSFKRLLLSRGFGRVESLDANGDDGSLVIDLSRPITDAGLVGQFDVVLNSGTSEHVMERQWRVFKNMHDLLGASGVLMHILPMEGRGHGFWFYDEEFFVSLARACGYAIVDLRSTQLAYKYSRYKHSIFAALQKRAGSEFVDQENWIDPTRDTLGFRRYGADYTAFVERSIDRANG